MANEGVRMTHRLDAIGLHHLAARLHEDGVPLLPRLVDLAIFLLYNCSIHHTTRIGPGTQCAHRGMSVLIHRDAVIGARVHLGAHVVIGSRGLDWTPARIEDDVLVGANACILGPITVGRGAVIGAGSVVLGDVPAGARAAGNPARIIACTSAPPTTDDPPPAVDAYLRHDDITHARHD